MTKLAYLFPAFPVFHQTFVLWEVIGLRRNGVNPKLYSLYRPTGRQQPEADEVAPHVTYLPPMWSLRVLRANLRLMRAGLRRYWGLYRAILDAWQTGAVTVAQGPGAIKQRIAWRHRLRGWFHTNRYAYLLKSWWVIPSGVFLAEDLDRAGITHLHVHWASYPATVAYVVHCVSGLPFSISAHAYDIYMVPRMLPTKVRAARFVVTCAQANAAFLKQLTGAGVGDKIIVSYHGVDLNRFSPASDAANATEMLTIVSCGQLLRYKGMHWLVDACAQLRDRGIATQCFIIGDGPQRESLERQITQYGLNANVHLMGALSQAEVAAVYRKADLFVLASELAGKWGRRDVIANVIVEAMAVGLPVVASSIPGVAELIEHGVSGYLFPPNDLNGLVAAMLKLAASPDLRRQYGQAARRRVLRDFDNTKNVRALADLLRAPSGIEIQRLAVGS